MSQLARKTTMRDIWNAYGNVERAGLRFCQVVYDWVEDGGFTHDGTPAEKWARYLSASLKVTRRRVQQWYQSGKVLAELGTRVPDRRLLDNMTEAHLRHLAPLADDPELLEEVWAEIDEQVPDEPKKRRKIAHREVKKVVNAVKARHAPTPGWEDHDPPPSTKADILSPLAPTVKESLRLLLQGFAEIMDQLNYLEVHPPGSVDPKSIGALRDCLKQHEKSCWSWQESLRKELARKAKDEKLAAKESLLPHD